ncbi:hypothetical protein [Phytoactinopolyspora halotolerans]|uniref:Type IV secretion system protein n=1 Tax=Phytoactinopolyspora halotolerans TaxID=1981512 RepID=A0A6L9S9K0_9ACTN|nr:hypothetical protein [Phytoactinopolyspora halotolerans]NEE01198.1 hypothetical protein [Phytoactinopolyspora halotolerans]
MDDDMQPAGSACDSLDPFTSFVCRTVTDGGVDPGGWLYDETMSRVARAMAEAAETMVTAMWSLIMETTAVDLTADWVRANVATVMMIALPIVIALYMVQLTSAAWRRQPGELARAVVGMVGGLSASAVALSATQSVLMLTDWGCDLIMRWRVGAEVGEAIEALTPAVLVAAASGQGAMLPAMLIIVFGFFFIVASFTVWFALMARKALIIVAAVFAPFAFAGLASRYTSGWVSKWVSIMFALALSKITVVMVFAIAVGAIRAGLSGQADSTLRAIGELSMGLMLLTVAALAPWLTYKFLDFITPGGREWDGTVGRSAATVQAGSHSARTMMIRSRTAMAAGRATAPAAAASSAAVIVRRGRRPNSTR